MPQHRLRVLYKAADVLVSASKFETLGMTVIEAQLCGTPAVVQNAAGFVTQVRVHLCTVTFHANLAHSLTRSP